MSELDHDDFGPRMNRAAGFHAAAPMDMREDEAETDAVVEAFRLCVSRLAGPLVARYDVLALCDASGRQLASHGNAGSFRMPDHWAAAEIGRNAAAVCLATRSEATVSFREHDSAWLQEVQTAAAPLITEEGLLYGALLLAAHEDNDGGNGLAIELQHIKTVYECCRQIAAERSRSRELAVLQDMSSNMAHKRELLFQAAKKLNALIDVDRVLAEMIDYVKKLYPAVEADLLLTQDYDSSSLPVKPLVFAGGRDDICVRAFMEGQPVYEISEPGTAKENPPGSASDCATIAVPLSGKQGVYGVLRLRLINGLFDSADVQFISMLADCAGIAFENAILYRQSNLLIGELRLINELTKRLSQSLRLSDIFTFTMTEMLHIFGADFCCILQLDKEKDKLVVRASNLPVLSNENFEMDYGFSGIVSTSKEPVIISDYWSSPQVKSKLMEITNSRSLIASPILANGEVIGVILLAGRKPHYFTYDNYKLLQALSGHVGVAMTNAALHAEVRRMVNTDRLTGMYVRHYLDEQVHLFQKKDFCGSLILVDIDHFKKVNDTFGHQIGDAILIQVSHIMRTCIRESDIAARWGGEELAVYLPQVTIEQTVRVAERIRTRVHSETNPQVTVSCGVSDWSWQDDKISVESLFYKADMALYEAKNNGRNQVRMG
ncbi:diguanylate cyclase [Paenibacillus hamazuiensis]|uniref:diguanylate cyclase n=1 Tax=Paenibacillus hamazuiensis TaxID=2936508 RepID=UPI00200CEC93|nr:diguanylate cyclase [Paenibacillus hamazuiensis]